MALRREMHAIISDGNVPAPSVGKADAQLLSEDTTVSRKGVGIVNELLAEHPFAQRHGRRRDQ